MKKIILFSILFFIFIINTSNKSYKYNLNEINNTLITTLETKYNLKIYTNKEVNYESFKAIEENNTLTINNALYKLSKILSKFNKEFFNTFYNYNYDGLNIYLTGNITPYNMSLKALAYSVDYKQKYNIIMDINSSNLEEVICHELMHNIEYNIIKSNEAFPSWNTLNPNNFIYDYNYNTNFTYNYTLSDLSNNIYFTDSYSKTYPEEDRARIFEKICAHEANLKYYPNLYHKALYLKAEILKYFPSLKNTSLFKNVI